MEYYAKGKTCQGGRGLLALLKPNHTGRMWLPLHKASFVSLLAPCPQLLPFPLKGAESPLVLSVFLQRAPTERLHTAQALAFTFAPDLS